MAEQIGNYTIPAGKIFFNRLKDDGTYDGERWLGNTPGATLSVETTKIEHWKSYTKVREKDRDIVTQIDRTQNIVCDDMSDENYSLFLAGSVATLSQTSGDVTDEEHDGVNQGRYYQLGESSSFPAGARNVSAVVVKDDDGSPTTFTVGEDYTVEADLGRIYIVPGGAITNGTNLEISYTKAAVTIPQIKTGAKATHRGKLRIIAFNREGKDKDSFFPLVDLSASGDLQQINEGEDDSWQQINLTCEILKSDTEEAIIINGRAVPVPD